MQNISRFTDTCESAVFQEIAACLNSFLVVFQTDNPMSPFLADELERILRHLCSKFIRKNVLIGAQTTLQLLKVKLDDVKNQLPAADIDLGFGIQYELNLLKRAKKVSETQLLSFRRECQQFLVGLCCHMMEKSPLNSIMSRCLRAMSPICMAENPEQAEVYFNTLLRKLVAYKKVLPTVADNAKTQYADFLGTVVKENHESFISFKKETERLDSFLFSFLLVSKYNALASVVKIILILSHST